MDVLGGVKIKVSIMQAAQHNATWMQNSMIIRKPKLQPQCKVLSISPLLYINGVLVS